MFFLTRSGILTDRDDGMSKGLRELWSRQVWVGKQNTNHQAVVVYAERTYIS